MNRPRSGAESLPVEIQLKIFEKFACYPYHHIVQLQRVCHAWHLAAKQTMYRSPSIKTDKQIEKFAESHQYRIATTIPAPGSFVRELSLDRMNIQAISTLLRQCPNLESFEYGGDKGVICAAIRSLTTSALSRLKKLPKDHDINDPCVEKCRASLIEVHLTAEALHNIQDLVNFPQLKDVHYTGNMLGIYQILETCSNLRHLSIIQTTTSAKYQHTSPQHFKNYPSLKKLGISGVTSLQSLSPLLSTFSCLTELWVENLIIPYTSDDFALFCNHTSRFQKCQFTVSTSIDDNTCSELPLILSTISSSLPSNTQSGGYQNEIRLKIGFTKAPELHFNMVGRRRLIEMKLPERFLEDKQLQQGCIDGFGSIADSIMLFFEDTIQKKASNKTHYSSIFYTILQKCSRLQKVELVGGRYASIPNAEINTNLLRLKLEECSWDRDLLGSLSNTCPNLSSLETYSTYNESRNINISMPYSSLDFLTLKFRYFPVMTKILIRVKLRTIPETVSYFLIQERSKQEAFKVSQQGARTTVQKADVWTINLQAIKISQQDVRTTVKKADVWTINLEFKACKKIIYDCKTGPAIMISPGSFD